MRLFTLPSMRWIECSLAFGRLAIFSVCGWKTSCIPTCFVPSCPADFVGQAGKVAKILLRKADRLRTNPDQPLKLLVSGAPGIATTRMIAAGAAGNVRAAMANLEMWMG